MASKISMGLTLDQSRGLAALSAADPFIRSSRAQVHETRREVYLIVSRRASRLSVDLPHRSRTSPSSFEAHGLHPRVPLSSFGLQIFEPFEYALGMASAYHDCLGSSLSSARAAAARWAGVMWEETRAMVAARSAASSAYPITGNMSGMKSKGRMK